MGKSYKASSDGIYIRCINPSGDEYCCSYKSHKSAYGKKCGYELFHLFIFKYVNIFIGFLHQILFTCYLLDGIRITA